jgi:hypothetical protein
LAREASALPTLRSSDSTETPDSATPVGRRIRWAQRIRDHLVVLKLRFDITRMGGSRSGAVLGKLESLAALVGTADFAASARAFKTQYAGMIQSDLSDIGTLRDQIEGFVDTTFRMAADAQAKELLPSSALAPNILFNGSGDPHFSGARRIQAMGWLQAGDADRDRLRARIMTHLKVQLMDKRMSTHAFTRLSEPDRQAMIRIAFHEAMQGLGYRSLSWTQAREAGFRNSLLGEMSTVKLSGLAAEPVLSKHGYRSENLRKLEDQLSDPSFFKTYDALRQSLCRAEVERRLPLWRDLARKAYEEGVQQAIRHFVQAPENAAKLSDRQAIGQVGAQVLKWLDAQWAAAPHDMPSGSGSREGFARTMQSHLETPALLESVESSYLGRLSESSGEAAGTQACDPQRIDAAVGDTLAVASRTLR